ncbi:hypothetical protein AB0N77_21505 [Streptomyces misionensis]|uniref:hypothetical protein n=1 Tax=Streptomyces misionensis TaxID=67331 RepID=UPI0034341098
MPASNTMSAPAEYDHTQPVPEITVHGAIAGRTARFALRPALLDIEAGTAYGVTVRASLRYRIPLVFEAAASRRGPGQWAVGPVRCRQDSHLASVQTVHPHVAAAMTAVVNQHNDQLLPLLEIARERQAGNALALVHKYRREAAETAARLREAQTEFDRHGVPAERALKVLEAMTRARDKLWGLPQR